MTPMRALTYALTQEATAQAALEALAGCAEPAAVEAKPAAPEVIVPVGPRGHSPPHGSP